MNTGIKLSIENWKHTAKRLKSETQALYLAYRHPRTPWYAKVFAGLVIAYAFSPIDLIPDFIPVLGYLDDLLLVPLGITFAIKMIPPEVMADCRMQVEIERENKKPGYWLSAVIIIVIWVTLAAIFVIWLLDLT